MIRRIILGLALGLASAVIANAAQRPTIVDGDTLVLDGRTIRLWGVDAPEGRQTCFDARGAGYRCGDLARNRLRDLIGTRPVSCQARDRDRYDRTVAQCRVAGIDLGEALVREGLAVEYRQFSRGAYSGAEAAARQTKRGIWAGRFEAPAEWRAEDRLAKTIGAPVPQPNGKCVIKGNVNAQGRRIFHSPGQEDYAATRIDTAAGERWFCSAAEALAAGWRPAQR
jgi:endonuclease YncB( thermonuclease family)